MFKILSKEILAPNIYRMDIEAVHLDEHMSVTLKQGGCDPAGGDR